jgi:hypothetical protein
MPKRLEITEYGDKCRGDAVVVRAFGGRPHMRRVWESTSAAVFICTEERFQRMWRGEPDYPPTGFPREDVFEYDATLLAELEANWQTDPTVWNRATLWTKDQK